MYTYVCTYACFVIRNCFACCLVEVLVACSRVARAGMLYWRLYPSKPDQVWCIVGAATTHAQVIPSSEHGSTRP